MSGFVYFLRCGRFVKIGFSKRPANRHRFFRSGCPYEFELLGTFAGTQRQERYIHKLLASRRHRGEWFEDCAEIHQLLRCGIPSAPEPSKPRSESSILLSNAIRLAGSEAKLGKATGYTQNAIWQAKTRGSVTPLMALKIERALDGKVPAIGLCPSLQEPDSIAPLQTEGAA